MAVRDGKGRGGEAPALGSGLLGDVAFARRGALRRPGFALAVAATLGLGIGANVAVFAVVHAVVLAPLPYVDPEGLYDIVEVHESGRLRVASYPTFLDWQREAEVLGPAAFARGAPLAYRTEDAAGLLLGAFVTEGFFPLLGVEAELGRGLAPDDHRPDALGVVVVSHRAWRRWLGSDPDVVGRTLGVDGLPLTVVGVMPRSFAYPDWGADNDLWIPLSQLPPGERAALEQRGFNADSRIVARLASGVSVAQAESRLAAFATSLAGAHPDVYAGWGRVRLRPPQAREIALVRPRLFMLWAAVGLVLAICGLNLSALYLVHGTARRREYAVRSALGADDARLLRLALVEALLLAAVGGAAGVLVAAAGLSRVPDGVGSSLPRVGELAMGPAVLGVALLLVLGSASVFALLATREVRRAALRPLLTGARGATVSAGLLEWIQAGQVALTFVLLLGAGLLGRSYLELVDVEPGYDPRGLVLVPVNPPSPAYDTEEAATALYGALLDAVAAVPGVTAVGLTNHGPGGTAGAPTPAAVGGAPTEHATLAVRYRTVSAGYFGALGMRLVAGREFSAADLAGPPGPLVINETLAMQWGGTSPVGETFGVLEAASSRSDFGQPLLGRVVGVVEDLDPTETGGAPLPVVYVPFTHSPWGQARLLVRVADPTSQALRAIEDAVWRVDPAIPLTGPFVRVRRMDEIRSAVRSEERWNAYLVGIFAAAAVTLAAVGLYGVVSYGVALRTRALGVRLALGATPAGVVRGVLGRIGTRVAAGLAAGVLTGLLLANVLRGLLYGVDPFDPRTYAGAAIFLALVALAAAYLPARRAARVDPSVTLRAEA